jgi:ACS family hexuronate transporter-like MFS transporter
VAPAAMGALIAASGGSYIAAFCLLLASAVTSAAVAMIWRPTGAPVYAVQPAGTL